MSEPTGECTHRRCVAAREECDKAEKEGGK